MPLVRIDLAAGHSPEGRAAISAGVHQAMVDTFAVPPDDRFHIITEHASATEIVHAPSYLGIEYTDGLIFIQITCNDTRNVDQKKALYAAIADNLAADPGARREDIFINIVEVKNENWSFGNGIGQYA